MAALSKKLRSAEGGRLLFWCPGCDGAHQVQVGEPPLRGRAGWDFNGDYDRPTFSPSVLVRTGHYAPGQEGKDCWCTYEQRLGKTAPFKCSVCHSFVRDGQIQFLGDCTHALAGQTVPLPDFDE